MPVVATIFYTLRAYVAIFAQNMAAAAVAADVTIASAQELKPPTFASRLQSKAGPISSEHVEYMAI
eukprot:4858564-Pleurochrysis_carterae.AAC.1